MGDGRGGDTASISAQQQSDRRSTNHCRSCQVSACVAARFANAMFFACGWKKEGVAETYSGFCFVFVFPDSGNYRIKDSGLERCQLLTNVVLGRFLLSHNL